MSNPFETPPPKARGAVSAGKLSVSSGVVQGLGERIGIYGPGGIGKTELVASAAKAGVTPLFIDLDGGTSGLDVARVKNEDGNLISTFSEIRGALQNEELIRSHGLVAIDTLTRGEEVIGQHVIEHVPHEKGDRTIECLEDYGFGKGLVHVFDHGLMLLQDLDQVSRWGVHVVLVCHQVTEKVPNADVEDYLEYQPRLQSPPRAGKFRERVFEWTNHFFRVDHNRSVKDGRVKGGDSRSIHTVRSTTAWAKHRTMPNGKAMPPLVPYTKGSYDLWDLMFN